MMTLFLVLERWLAALLPFQLLPVSALPSKLDSNQVVHTISLPFPSSYHRHRELNSHLLGSYYRHLLQLLEPSQSHITTAIADSAFSHSLGPVLPQPRAFTIMIATCIRQIHRPPFQLIPPFYNLFRVTTACCFTKLLRRTSYYYGRTH
jgi:hypothetical protein